MTHLIRIMSRRWDAAVGFCRWGAIIAVISNWWEANLPNTPWLLLGKLASNQIKITAIITPRLPKPMASGYIIAQVIREHWHGVGHLLCYAAHIERFKAGFQGKLSDDITFSYLNLKQSIGEYKPNNLKHNFLGSNWTWLVLDC